MGSFIHMGSNAALPIFIALAIGAVVITLLIFDSFSRREKKLREQLDKTKKEPETERESVPASGQRGQLLVACRRMAQRMLDSLQDQLKKPTQLMDMTDTGGAIEMDIIIGDGVLKADQQRVIIPYDRVKDLVYWQQITQIILVNHRAKFPASASVETKVRPLNAKPNGKQRLP